MDDSKWDFGDQSYSLLGVDGIIASEYLYGTHRVVEIITSEHCYVTCGVHNYVTRNVADIITTEHPYVTSRETEITITKQLYVTCGVV